MKCNWTTKIHWIGEDMICKLSDIVNTANTGADAIKKAPILNEPTNLRCLRIGDVSQKRDFSMWGYTKTSKMDYERYKLHKGDSIIARTGNTIGVCTYIEDDIESVYNNGLIRLTAKTELARERFLFYLIRSTACQDYIQSIAYGTSTQPNMKIKDFLNFDIIVPTLEIQDKIIAIVDKIEKKIQVNTEINNNLQQQAQAYFDELFVVHADPNWSECTLSDIGSVVAGGTPSKSKPEYYADQGIAWITPKDLSVNKSKFISHGENDISELGFSKSSAAKMPAGTILFSSRAPIGYIAIAQNEVTTNQGFKSVIPNENISTAYMYFLLKNLLPTIEGMASGSTFKEISGAAMKSVPTVMPDADTIQLFSSFCEPVFKEQEILEAENHRLSALRDSLLPKLMSGELDVSNIEL